MPGIARSVRAWVTAADASGAPTESSKSLPVGKATTHNDDCVRQQVKRGKRQSTRLNGSSALVGGGCGFSWLVCINPGR